MVQCIVASERSDVVRIGHVINGWRSCSSSCGDDFDEQVLNLVDFEYQFGQYHGHLFIAFPLIIFCNPISFPVKHHADRDTLESHHTAVGHSVNNAA